jgi:hypothetical protein
VEKFLLLIVAALGAGGYLLKKHIQNEPLLPEPGVPGSSSGGGTTVLPRGIRNNNPGNIMWDARNNWNGQTGKDAAGFSIFSEAKWGIRAMSRVLDAYARRGLDTIAKIIPEYTKGDKALIQGNYISFLEKQMAVNRDLQLNPALHRVALIRAMIQFENGQQPYSTNYIKEAIALP